MKYNQSLGLFYLCAFMLHLMKASSLGSEIENNPHHRLSDKDRYALEELRKEDKAIQQKEEQEKEDQYLAYLKDHSSFLSSQSKPGHFPGKQIVNDLLGYPPYEINKPFSTPYNISLHPIIPDKEPTQLMEMQSKLQKISTKIRNRGSPRFSEQEEKQQQKQGTGKFTAVQIQSAWASSVYVWKYLWWTYSYPASNAIRATSFWASAGDHKDDQVITWQGSFDKQYRISHVWVRWAMAPREYSLQISEDGRTWIEKIAWTDISKGEKRRSFRKQFPWYIWGDMSFAMNIQFDSPVWAKGIRILSRKVQYSFVGIYKVEVWVKDWVVMLVNPDAKNDEDEQCLQLLGNQVTSQVCLFPLASIDKRELFVLTNEGRLAYFNRPSLCVEADNSHLQTNRNTLSKNTRLTLKDCANKAEQLWIIDSSHKIRSKSNPQYCITEGNPIQLSDLKGLQAKASSCANDNQHNLQNSLEEGESYYMSNFNEGTVLLEFLFESYKVPQLSIHWRKQPKAFSVSTLSKDIWNQVFITDNNSHLETVVELGEDPIEGIKVKMTEFHPDAVVVVSGNKFFVYAIDKISVKTNVLKVGMEQCKDSQANKWFIMDVFYIYNEGVKNTFHMERDKVVAKSSQLMALLQKIILLPPIIKNQLGVAITVKSKISDIQSQLDANDVGVAQVADFVNEKSASTPPPKDNKDKDGDKKEDKKEDSKGPLGVHSKNPGKNCHFIKEKQTYKKSGFYWLKPQCAKQPIRVFCDFEIQRQGIAYAYYGGIKKDKKLAEQVTNIYQMRLICGRLGLEVAEIKGEEQFLTIKKYLISIGVVINTVDVVPIMYDYNCDQTMCKDRFKNLNDEESTDLTGLLAKHVIKIFSIQKNLNSAGFGLSKEGKLMKFNLGGKYKVKGLICSTNYDPKAETDYEVLQCEDTLKSKENLALSVSSNSYTLKCPAGCGSKTDLNIYGQSTYKQTSSICRAAVHSGEVDDSGGPVLVTTIYVKFKEGEQEKIQGMDNKGLQSLDFQIESPGEVAFSIQKVEILCPDVIAKKILKSKGLLKEEDAGPSSFLQTKAKSYLQMKSGIKIQDPSDDKRDNDLDKDSSGSGGSGSGGGGGGKGKGGKDSKTGTGMNLEEEEESDDKKEKFSNDIYLKVKAILDISNTQLKRVIRLVTDGVSLNKQINAQSGPLILGELQGDKQLKSIDSLENHLKGSFENLQEVQGKLKKLVKGKQSQFDSLFRRKMKMREYEPYWIGKEEFDEKIDRLFLQIDYELAENKPGKYSYEKLLKYNKVHTQGLVQQSAIKMKAGSLASVVIHKYKTYYDLKMKASIIMNDNGALGLLFRVMDFMNYYAFVVDKHKKVKKIIKVLEGKETILGQIEDGGFIVNQWYRVIITCIQGDITVRMEQEPAEKRFEKGKEEHLKIVLEVYDTSLSKGSIGTGVNNMLMSVIDDLAAEPLECSTVIPVSKVKYENSICHYYREYFNADMVDVWTKKEDESCILPAKWVYKKYKEYGTVLRQTEKYTLKNDRLVPSWFVFMKDKICNTGILLVEFIAIDTGMISIGFHFQNEVNHFEIQILPSTVNKCNLFRTVSGSQMLLKTNEEVKCGYTPGVHMRVRIDMERSKNILKVFNETEKAYQEVLESAYDGEFPNTRIALGTLKTRTVFTRFEFLDNKYYELLYGEAKDDQGDGKGGGPFKDEPKSFFRECYQYKTKEEQLQYCSSHFQSDFEAIIDCQNNFCDRCCFLQEPVEKTKQSMCVRKCLGGQKSGVKDKLYKQCIDSPKPLKSVYTHCTLVFQESIDQNSCMRDMCQMCCLTFNSQMAVSLDLESIRDCRMMCMTKYRMKTQYELDQENKS